LHPTLTAALYHQDIFASDSTSGVLTYSSQNTNVVSVSWAAEEDGSPVDDADGSFYGTALGV